MFNYTIKSDIHYHFNALELYGKRQNTRIFLLSIDSCFIISRETVIIVYDVKHKNIIIKTATCKLH